MLRNRKLLPLIMAFVMALTITGQVPVFALENEVSDQPVSEQIDEQEVQEEDLAADDMSSVPEETESIDSTGDGENDATMEEQIFQVKSVATDENIITASGLKNVSSPTSSKWDGKTIDISWYDPEQSEFNINTGAKLAGLAALVNGSYDKTITQYAGTQAQLSYIQCVKIDNFSFVGAGGGNTGGTCYKSLGNHDFMGKTIKITADIDMTSGNYMPIGGRYPMCDAAGSMYVNNEAGKGDAHVIEAFFNGILDCGGHTIKINCDRSTKSGYAYSIAVGFIGYMGAVIDEDDVERYGSPFVAQNIKKNWTPTVKNLSLEGKVHARRQIGGIVGQTSDAWDEQRGVFVENCANHTAVSGTDSKGVGGIVGNAGGKGHIINCYNTGDISSVYSTAPVGGVCASNGGMDIYNCYNTGMMDGNKLGRGLGGHDGGSYTIDNSYTLKGVNTDEKNEVWYEGTAAAITIKNAEALEKNEMTNEGFAQRLNAGDGDDNYDRGAFVQNDEINGGYPILWFENGQSGPECSVTIDEVSNGSISCLYNGSVLSSGSELQVPYGSVISLSEVHDGGYILNTYKAGSNTANMDLIADFCTVTENLHIGADIVQLKEGTLEIDSDESKDCTVSVTKKGFAYKNGEITPVKRQKVVSGDRLYQLDVINASAVLFENAYPEDVNKEYSGEFQYSFKYMKNGMQVGDTITNQTGKLTISQNIDGAQLVVSAEPIVQNKTWQSFADTSWYYEGEPGEDYLIDSAEDLAGLAYLVNVEQISFSGDTIVIPSGTVISLKNTDGRGGVLRWPGIGVNSSNAYFGGKLIGNGCTILDMGRIEENGSNGGLFNYCVNAEISGLNVRGKTQVWSVGGGIIGYGEGCKISNCINYVDVTNQKDKEGTVGNRAGGIIAQANGGSVTNCINRGDICAASGTGGIAGQCHGSEVTINNCTNYAQISTAVYTDSYNQTVTGSDGVGGIAGRDYGNMTLCANYGDICSTDANTGGIAGVVVAKGISKAFSVTGCYNRGEIDARSSSSMMCAGGLVGRCATVNLTNSYSAGTVTGSDTSSYICGGVGYFECKSGTSAVNNYVRSCSKAWGHDPEVSPDYISIAVKDDAYMKSEAFASVLNNPEYKAVSGSYPEFNRMSDSNSLEKTYTVSFRGSDLDGKSFLINNGGSIPYISAGDWSTYSFTADGEEWTGRNIISDVTVDVTKNENVSFYARFIADGQVVAETPYDRTTSYESIKPDASQIPEKDGYAGMWPDNITLNPDEDTIINAVYYPSGSTLDVQDEVAVTDGKYYIGGKSTGVITISEGSSAKLIGDSGLCENLRVVMEEGATLEMRNLQMSCDTESVLTMTEGCALTLTGSKNYVEGTDTDSKDCVPAINILGNSAFAGEGTLTATADTGDTVIDIADGKNLTISSGTYKLHKSSKIGRFDGGVINSGRDTDSGTGVLTIEGGTIYCTSNSDNMHAVKVGAFHMSGGDVLAVSNDEETALLAKDMSVSAGNLKVASADYDKNETDKSEKNRTHYYNEKAIGCKAFTDSHTCTKLAVSNMAKPYQVSVGAATFVCNGLSMDYSLDGEKLVKSADANIYVWGETGSETSVVPEGTDMSDPNNQRGYSVAKENDSVNIDMTGTKTYKKTWIKACATYDASGKMLEFNCKEIKDTSAIQMNTLSKGAVKYKVFVLQDRSTLVPMMPSYEANN